jgi:hypothetical protein
LIVALLGAGFVVLRSNPSLQSSLPPVVRTAINSISFPTGAPAAQTTTGAQQSSGSVVSTPVHGGGAPNSIVGLPSLSFKQQSKEITFDSCPPEGDGGDPILNMNKNRVDAGNFQPVAFDTIEKLPWPQETERKAHADWSQSAQNQVAQAEGLPVMVEGYLAEARQEGPETPNCHSSTDHDFHIWLLGSPGGASARTGAVVVEATPRVRANHPGWTVNALNSMAQSGTKVRISGWLMLDPEHPEQLGQTRGTLWEVHPIIEIEVAQGNQWIKLDN